MRRFEFGENCRMYGTPSSTIRTAVRNCSWEIAKKFRDIFSQFDRHEDNELQDWIDKSIEIERGLCDLSTCVAGYFGKHSSCCEKKCMLGTGQWIYRWEIAFILWRLHKIVPIESNATIELRRPCANCGIPKHQWGNRSERRFDTFMATRYRHLNDVARLKSTMCLRCIVESEKEKEKWKINRKLTQQARKQIRELIRFHKESRRKQSNLPAMATSPQMDMQI
jgi:hypothetical protein